jgi:very-short-patch-repair endonuclease
MILHNRAKTLRSNATDAASRMWFYLRNRRLNGYKFIRELVLGNYIADFACREHKLIVELDGSQHINNQVYDAKRALYLQSVGYKVLRVWNNEVFNNIDDVLQQILLEIERF